ncbi:MAG: SDR family NAD(P)-dependent oxidoreductase [Proteobacteria bacterium]|nr:SDR family NAD(P)-dependent oxidoreductase [Pseudomonadota bacterium]
MATFDASATAEQVTSGIDLSGKTALVTGVTAGIGLETMRVLALRGARVLAVGRTREKAAAAIAALSGVRNDLLQPFGCDQERLEDVVKFTDEIRALGAPLDVLVANAGVVGKWSRETIGGIEKTFVVNHLATFVLVNRLAPRVTPGGRIVIVSSNAHKRAPKTGIEFDNLSAERGYFFMKQYGQTKLANHLFTRSLARRLASTGTTANSLHPGRVYTNIFHNLPLPLRLLVHTIAKRQMKDIPTGASTMCYLAAHPEVRGVTGKYFADNSESVTGPHMTDDAMAERLWAVSEELTKAYL